MSLERDLFPEPHPVRKSPDWVQTEYAEGWYAQLMGIGYLTELVERHFDELGATRDQAGLAAVFLQRHRLEVGIKTIFNSLGQPKTKDHDLARLWTECKQLVAASSHFEHEGFTGQEVVDKYLKPHDELIRLLAKADPGSFSFRYPVDRAGNKVERPLYIDFRALERNCNEFEGDVTAIFETLREAGLVDD